MDQGVESPLIADDGLESDDTAHMLTASTNERLAPQQLENTTPSSSLSLETELYVSTSSTSKLKCDSQQVSIPKRRRDEKKCILLMLSRSISPLLIRFAPYALHHHSLSLSQYLSIPRSSNSIVNAVFCISLSTKPERTSRKFLSLFKHDDRQEKVVHTAASTCNQAGEDVLA